MEGSYALVFRAADKVTITAGLEEFCPNALIKLGRPQHYLLLFSIILTLQKQLQSAAQITPLLMPEFEFPS
jgi:hypothetical protein